MLNIGMMNKLSKGRYHGRVTFELNLKYRGGKIIRGRGQTARAKAET